MNTVATDYAYILIQVEKHLRDMHDACLMKKWELARNNALAIEDYMNSMSDWLDYQEDDKDAKFIEVWMPQQETV